MFTTYRLTEHHTAGGMSRWQPYLAELQPEFFCEVSPELARERGLDQQRLGDDRQRPDRDRGPGAGHRAGGARCGSAAGPCTRSACPTTGGSADDALVSGDSANDLFGVTLDANVHIQETKVASCDIQPGRRPRGPALLEYVAAYRERAGVTVATGNLQRTPPEGPDGRHASDAGSLGHSTQGQVGEGHAPAGRDTDAGPDGGTS